MPLVWVPCALKGAGCSVKSDPAARAASTERLYGFDRNVAEGAMVLAGVDEAGRGPLAGPVVAAAVILDLTSPIIGINDSKKLSPLKREQLYTEITASAREWAVGSATPEEIDRDNILRATFSAMQRAISSLTTPVSRILVDGNLKIAGIAAELQQTVVGGDALSASIAAASILAKVTRDRFMIEQHAIFPDYGFNLHKGYGTALHRERIQQFGLCPIHRKSFCSSLVLQTTLEL